MIAEAQTALRRHLMVVCQQARDCHVNFSVHSLRTYSIGYRVSSKKLSWSSAGEPPRTWHKQSSTQCATCLLFLKLLTGFAAFLSGWRLLTCHCSGLGFTLWLKFQQQNHFHDNWAMLGKWCSWKSRKHFFFHRVLYINVIKNMA